MSSNETELMFAACAVALIIRWRFGPRHPVALLVLEVAFIAGALSTESHWAQVSYVALAVASPVLWGVLTYRHRDDPAT